MSRSDNLNKMRLLIISHTRHYEQAGRLVGWGPTVQEIDCLAQLFSEVIHVAPVHKEAPLNNALPYQAENVRVAPVRPAGGQSLKEKLSILTNWPHYFRAIRPHLKTADVVHIRCPANISLLAIMLLSLANQPAYRWVKYAGNWKPAGSDHVSYWFQRWWLQKNLHRGVVTVNGRWPDQPAHIHSFDNPSLTQQELETGQLAAQNKIQQRPFQLLFVGGLNESKGAGRVLEIASALQKKGTTFALNLLGDGPDRRKYETAVHEAGLANCVTIHGWLPKTKLAEYYKTAHFLVLPSATEGWPKVLSEAMAYGIVPIAGAVGSIPQILSETGAGVSLPPYDIPAFTLSIIDMMARPAQWRQFSQAGIIAARRFSFSTYLNAVQSMAAQTWDIQLRPEYV